MTGKKKSKKGSKRSKQEDETTTQSAPVDTRQKTTEDAARENTELKESVKKINDDLMNEGRDMFMKRVPEKIRELTEFINVGIALPGE